MVNSGYIYIAMRPDSDHTSIPHLLSRYFASSMTITPAGEMESTSETEMEKVSKKVAGRKERPKSSYLIFDRPPVSGLKEKSRT